MFELLLLIYLLPLVTIALLVFRLAVWLVRKAFRLVFCLAGKLLCLLGRLVVAAFVLVAGEKVHSVAEIELLNHDKVTNGVIQLHLEEISYRALPEDLTDRIQLDLDGVKVGDSIKVKDLPFAQNPQIELLTDPEAIVVSVTEVRNTEEAETEEEAAE